jgi:pimeloyl-ACP methyl ester carboxylesterase
VHDAIDKTVDLVGEGHESTARTVMRVTDRIPTVEGPARLVNDVRRLGTRGVLGSIKLVNRGVQAVENVALDVALSGDVGDETPVPMRSDAMTDEALRAEWASDAALALVNAVVGDHLDAKENDLRVSMQLRIGDRYFDPHTAHLPEGTRRAALYVHGLGTSEWSWCLEGLSYHGDAGASFGSLLERDLGIVPVYARYNTGRRISTNGRALERAIEGLIARSPDLEELILVGHSMGGLVIRSACHYGGLEQRDWLSKVHRVFCLGSPHRGAPLEKLGNVLTGVLGAIDLPGTLVTARLLEGRSAGIKDLRHGALVDEDWLGKDPDALVDPGRAEVPLLPGVAYHFVSAALTQDPQHPLGQLIGDLLVREASAHGPQLSEHFPIETARFGGVLHHQLQNHPAIYQVLKRACAPIVTDD